MRNLKKFEVFELNNREISEVNGGGLSSGMNSLFRSSLWLGSKALDVGLSTLGFLAGLGDGIRNGMNN